MVLILLATPPSFASASSKALCVTLASSRSLKLLPMLGVPSLPSFAMRLWRGESDDRGARDGGLPRDTGCDWAEEEDDAFVPVAGGACGLFNVVGVVRRAFCNFGDILTVAPGSAEGMSGFLVAVLSEKGRNGGESEESSEASDNGPRRAFEVEVV